MHMKIFTNVAMIALVTLFSYSFQAPIHEQEKSSELTYWNDTNPGSGEQNASMEEQSDNNTGAI